ncbi:MAG: HAMP domain-containing histidine kinase [Acetobacter sp.]|nr:HAMP domain-containing histidine kinase [Bacteroides sp.]MCM1342139.1 HAMP domain-containing histidine kinase [Acetobacter sp.]MCM1434358.1 HAMP domain-containing histidine kinase [Clostridiales bacterium]
MINKDVKIIFAVSSAITVLLTIICAVINIKCAVICFVLGAAVTAVFVCYTKKRFDKLNKLNDYLSLICSGNYFLDVSENTEGELSILQNNLYKVISILQTQKEQLEKDKIYLADSLADISHQLKTPLTSVMVMTDLLKNNQNDNKKEEFIDIIETQLDKMKWLITNLLKMSKLDADTADFKKESVSARDVINQSIKPFMITLDIKNIDFIDEAGDFIFDGDRSWSIEAFQNIIKNCIEHTAKNGKLSITTKKTMVYNSVFIKDSGTGIAKKDLPHIFERFYHGENSSGESVGIGLALAKTIFEKEKAEIFAESEENKGTEFEIRFYKSVI